MKNIKIKQKLTINGFTEEEEEEILKRLKDLEDGKLKNFLVKLK